MKTQMQHSSNQPSLLVKVLKRTAKATLGSVLVAAIVTAVSIKAAASKGETVKHSPAL